MISIVIIVILVIILLSSLELLSVLGIVALFKNIFDNRNPERAKIWAKRVLIVGFLIFLITGIVEGFKIYSVYHCNDRDLNNLHGKDKLICAFESKERELKQIDNDADKSKAITLKQMDIDAEDRRQDKKIEAEDRRQDKKIEADHSIAITLKQMDIDAEDRRQDKKIEAEDRRQDKKIEADHSIAKELKQMEIDAANARHAEEMALKYPNYVKESVSYEIIDTHDISHYYHNSDIVFDHDYGNIDWI